MSSYNNSTFGKLECVSHILRHAYMNLQQYSPMRIDVMQGYPDIDFCILCIVDRSRGRQTCFFMNYPVLLTKVHSKNFNILRWENDKPNRKLTF